MKTSAAFLALLVGARALGQETTPRTVRLVAADRPDRPLVSQPTDFRYSPFGGLIATDWLSGVTLGDRALFPLTPLGEMPPQPSPNTAPAQAKAPNAALEALVAELTEEKSTVSPLPSRACDLVDPLYLGRVFERAPLRQIGPRHVRHAQATIESGDELILRPGDIVLNTPGESVRRAGPVIEITCYPVRIRAVEGCPPHRHVPFTPDLRWQNRDLLADLRYEHSPALPSGPPAGLCDHQGRPLRFFELTLYLLPTLHFTHRSAPYTLNGMPFHLSQDGLVLENPTGALRKTGPFELEWILPDRPSPPEPSLLAVVAAGGTTLRSGKEESTERLWIPRTALRIEIRRAGSRTFEPLAFEIPDFAREWTNALAIVRADQTASPQLHLLAAPPAETTREGTLRFLWTRWTTRGPLDPPAELTVRLVPFGALPLSLTGFSRRALHQGNGLYEIPLGDLAPRLYALRLPDHLPDPPSESLIVCVLNPTAKGSVTLHTRHNRCDYRQDEGIELFVTVRTAQASPENKVDLLLADPVGRTSFVGRITFPAMAAPQSRTRFAVIPAAQLQPGRYRLIPSVEDGSWIGHEARLMIQPLEPVTTWEGFATRICETGPFRTPLGLCSYHMLQQSPADTLQTPQERAQWLDQHRLPLSTRPACLADPFFPPPAATEPYDETEQALASALRFGVQFLPHGAWGMDSQTANWNPLHSYAEGLDWMRRMYSLRAQIHREFASFGGFFMNWYPSLGAHYENHPHRAGFAELQTAVLQQAIREAQGPLPEGWAWTADQGFVFRRPDGSSVPENEILETGPTHPLFSSPAFHALVEWKVRGQQRRTRAFANAYAAWTETVRTLGEWNYLTFVPVGWFRSPDYYPPIYFSTVPRAGIHAYTDWQVDPFQELFGIDYYGAGAGKPPWVQAFSGGRNFHIRQSFLALARGAWGLGLDAKTFVPSGRFGEELRQLAGLLHRYGPYAMTLRPESTVAILRSFHQEAADTGDFKGSGGRNGMIWFTGLQGELYTLYFNLLRSGRPAAFITEEQIAAGELPRYAALFLHRQRLPLPPHLMRSLHDFVANGGLIFKDPLTAPEYPGEEVNLGPDESVQPDVGSSRHIIGQRYLWMLRNYFQCRDRLEAVLRRLPPPRVRSDHPHIVTASMVGRDTALVMAVNDTMVPPVVHTAEASWFVQGLTLARQGRLFFNRPYVVYDVTEGGRETRLAETGERNEDAWVYPVDFRWSEGRMLILTERPIRTVRFRATLLRRLHDDALQITPSILDDSGTPFADPLPVEIILSNPEGDILKQVYRAAGPDQPVILSLGRNAAVGTWTISVRELVSGREATSPFTIPNAPPLTLGLEQDGRLLLRRPEEIERFLHRKTSFLILLDEGQPDFCRQAAEKLAEILQSNGKRCKVLTLDPFTVQDLPLRWRRNTWDEGIWRQVTNGIVLAVRRGLETLSGNDWCYYDHPDSGYQQPGPRFALFRDVILIGMPGHHRLIKDLHDTVGLTATHTIPGPGAAIVQTVWDAFAPRFDALTIQAGDTEGCEVALTALSERIQTAPSSPVQTEKEIARFESPISDRIRVLPDVQKYGFGTPVQQIRPLDSGQFLVSLAGVSVAGPAHFILDGASGLIEKTIPNVFGALEPAGEQRFLQRWRDRLVFRDPSFQPLLQLRGDLAYGILLDPHSGRMFAAGDNLVLGLEPDGRTRWVRDFRFDIRNEADFLKPRRLKVRALSDDGRSLLVSSHRPRFYGRQVVGYEDPALFLFDTESGNPLWKRDGILILDTACQFSGDWLIACHAGELRESPSPILFFLNKQGEPLQQISLPQPAVRIHGPDSSGFAVIEYQNDAPPQIVHLETARFDSLPVPGMVRAVWAVEGKWVVSTWEGTVHVLRPDFSPERTVEFPSSISSLHRPGNGRGWMVGTDSGQILRLDEQWKVVTETDLNRFNEMESERSWTARWLGELPTHTAERWIVPRKDESSSTLDRVKEVADVTDIPLPFPPKTETTPVYRAPGIPLLEMEHAGRPDATYVLSFFQQARAQNAPLGQWEVQVGYSDTPKPTRFLLPASPNWEERTVSFRPPNGVERFRLSVVPRVGTNEPSPQFAIDRPQLAELRFRTPNLLRAEIPAPPAEKGVGATAFTSEPPDIRMTIPWVTHLARAMGQTEQPPPILIPWTTLVDGKVEGQESSWTGKPLPQGIFSDHAEMVLTFKKPKRLAAVALYHDGASPDTITRKFAVFARTAKGVKLLGSETDNKSPYTLFTFEPVEARALIWWWAGSPDGHVRLLEIEAYGPEPPVEEMLEAHP